MTKTGSHVFRLSGRDFCFGRLLYICLGVHVATSRKRLNIFPFMHKGAGFWAETRILTRGRWLATFSTLFNTKERVFPVTHKNFHTCQVEFWPETQQTGCCLGFYFSSSAQWISVAGHPGRTSIQFSTHWLCEQKMAEQTA